MSLSKMFLEIFKMDENVNNYSKNNEIINDYTKRIDQGDSLNGNLHFKGNLVIDGHLEGDITFDENSIIILNKNGFLKTDNLICNQLIVFGKVECLNLTSNFLQVENGSSLEVKELLKLKYLNVKNGGILNSKVSINENNSTIGSFDIEDIKKYYEKNLNDFSVQKSSNLNANILNKNEVVNKNIENNVEKNSLSNTSKNIKNNSASVAKERLLNVKS